MSTSLDTNNSGPSPIVPNGTLLVPGSYLAEIRLERPCAPEVLERGLERMGFIEVYIDLSALPPPKPRPTTISRRPPHVRSLGPGGVKRPDVSATLRGAHFLGRLDRPISLRNTESVTWGLAHRFKTWDPYENIRRYTIKYFRLITGVTYEIRFLVRALPGKSSRESVESELREMGGLGNQRGWNPHRLTAVKKNMRMPGRSAADVTLWLGLATWLGPKSYITGDDPFYFEDVVPI